jgi:hypothetical protein
MASGQGRSPRDTTQLANRNGAPAGRGRRRAVIGALPATARSTRPRPLLLHPPSCEPRSQCRTSGRGPCPQTCPTSLSCRA